jgi:polysaccharide export outer membrane protein
MVLRALFAVLLFGQLASCAGPITTAQLEVRPEVLHLLDAYRREYILAAGDQVEVWLRGDPPITRLCLIRADGYLSLPTLRDVKAAGLTVPELDSLLTQELSERLLNPEVKVIVTVGRQPTVYVVGEVARPGPIPLREAKSAAQAVADAGGFMHSAARENVSVIRLTPDGKLQAYRIESPAEGQPAPYMALQTMILQPDDLIVVPANKRSQFARFVDDIVNRPLSGIVTVLSLYVQFRLIHEAFK